MRALILSFTFLLASCGGNPVKEAVTAEQQAFAVYGSWVIAQEQMADLVEQPELPFEIVEKVYFVNQTGEPVMNDLKEATIASIEARRQIEAGETSQEVLTQVLIQLESRYKQASISLTNAWNTLKEAFDGTR